MRLVFAVCASLVAAAPLGVQTIRVGPSAEVARETDPRRFSEPHLAVHPTDPTRLLATAFTTALAEAVPAMHASMHCSTFASRDGERSWARHDFPLSDCGDPQVAILPDGQAVFVVLAEFPGITSGS